MGARGTDVVRPVAEGEGCLGRNQEAGARQVLDRLAQNLLGEALRVDIRGVEKVDAGFHTEIDEPSSFRHICLTPCAEKFISATESRRAKTKNGNLQTTSAELSEFHEQFDGLRGRLVACYCAPPWR